jgi:hypothetical protein
MPRAPAGLAAAAAGKRVRAASRLGFRLRR